MTTTHPIKTTARVFHNFTKSFFRSLITVYFVGFSGKKEKMFKFCVDKNRIQTFVITSDIFTSGSKLNSSVFISSCYFSSCGELIVLLQRL